MPRPIKILLLFILGVAICFGVFVYLVSTTPLLILMPANVKYKVLLARAPEVMANKECGISCRFFQLGTIAKAFFVEESKMAEILKDKSTTPEEREMALFVIFNLKKGIEEGGGGNMFSKKDVEALCQAGGDKEEAISLRRQILEILVEIAGDDPKVIELEIKVGGDQTEDLELRRIAIKGLGVDRIKKGKESVAQAASIFVEAMNDYNLCALAQQGLQGIKDNTKYKALLEENCLDRFMASIDTGEMELSEEEQQKIIEENISILAEPTEEEKKMREEAKAQEERENQERLDGAIVIKDKNKDLQDRMEALKNISNYSVTRIKEEKEALYQVLLDKEDVLKLRRAVLYKLFSGEYEETEEYKNEILNAMDKIIIDSKEDRNFKEAAVIRREAPNWIYQGLLYNFNFDEKSIHDENIYEIKEAIRTMETLFENVPTDAIPEKVQEAKEFLEKIKKYSK